MELGLDTKLLFPGVGFYIIWEVDFVFLLDEDAEGLVGELLIEVDPEMARSAGSCSVNGST